MSDETTTSNSAPAAGDSADTAALKASEAAASAQAEGKGGGGKPDAASSDKASPAADAGKETGKSAGKEAGKEAASAPDADLAALLASVPEAVRGKDVPETLQKLMDGNKHFRDHIAKNGLPPEKIEDYGYKPTDKLASDFFTGSEGDKKLTDAVLGVFKEHGVGKMQATGMLNGILEQVVTVFDLEPAVNVEKERAALLPIDARGLPAADQKAAIDSRIDEAHGFVKTLERQGLDAGAVNQLAGLCDTADGVRLVEFIRANLRGDGLALNGQGSGNAGQLAELEKLKLDPRYNDDMKFRTETQMKILAAKGKA